MKRLIIEPDGWECKLNECRPGLFVHDDGLFLRNDYHEFFLCDGGDALGLCGFKDTQHRGEKMRVQPVKAVWVEEGVD